MHISCAFATSSDSPAHVELAETLGYKRAWLYDSPALYPTCGWFSADVRSARRASASGPACWFPVCAIRWSTPPQSRELVGQAPGRVGVAIGSGFTGRLALGKRPMPWRQVADCVRCVKALLAGETAKWEGAKVRMLQLHLVRLPRQRPDTVTCRS
jgi:5,10-methylenetetrahydromethanopterin reductase